MNQYKEYRDRNGDLACILFGSKAIPLDPANTDYANFKKEINEETAQLQDADGNTMTSSEAKAFVATLP